jgi:sulfite reductase (ferredoxin)
MVLAARALLRGQTVDITNDETEIVAEFKSRFYDTELFFDRFAKGKFGQYLFKHHRQRVADPDAVAAHETIEEAYLFIEAAHACDGRIAAAATPTTGGIQL